MLLLIFCAVSVLLISKKRCRF
ncbi:hypothetical protein [Flavobacterium davisii]